MAYEIPDFLVGVFPADVDMSSETSQQFTGVCVYSAVSVEGAGIAGGIGGAALCPPASTSVPIIGVLQNNPQQGEAGEVMIQGVTKAVCKTGWSIGALLSVDQSTGKFQPATSGQYAVAVGLEAAASGDVTTILLLRNGKQ